MKDVVASVVERIGTDKSKVIPVLQTVQDELNYLPSEALKLICEMTDITPGQITGVSTFYSQFRHLPYGNHIIKICNGTACHVKGASLVIDAFRRELEIKSGTNTSDDGMFSIQEVACLGCCTLAPVVQIDNKTYGHAKTTEVNHILKDFLSSSRDRIVTDSYGYDEYSDTEIRVGLGSCCIAGGSRDVLIEVNRILKQYKIKARVKSVGCVGVCNQTPLLEFAKKNGQPVRYTNVQKDQVTNIVLKHLKPPGKRLRIKTYLDDWIDTFHSDEKVSSPITLPDDVREKYLNNFLKNQKHIATEYYGELSPFSLDEYVSHNGFEALQYVLKNLTPEDLVKQIIDSGLRGRGGGGFPAGEKWNVTGKIHADIKYVICNGDEGDPGAFMDRMLIESFPYRVLEGMMIAAYAVGASHGILYIRAEYSLAVERIKNAIERCIEKGLIGKKLYGTEFSININLFEGAGAFVCGEETALIASIEGDRGNPKYRPPYPAEEGYRGKPTLVNNPETLCQIPWIVRNGNKEFRSIGTDNSRGTKVFALAGKVARGGFIEVPMGITIREIVEGIGGGVANDRKFKAVQIGGPSGGCIPEKLADTPVDFDELTKLGAMMGSGGLVVLDDTDCMVDMAKYFLTFTHDQSCGKCTFCRVGTRKMLELLTRFSNGEASMEELDELENLCHSVINGSLCGLGKTAPNPVLTSLKYFREEYEAHTRGECPARKCPDLIKYQINDKCIGCTLCVRECPVDAIPYKPYEKHEIDSDICIKCDSCVQVCPADAIEK
ncbi:MAG: 4Fe-4S dicluster domain-containing protein [Bacteroidetes bacterium]|nr:4Fe-4S dicluster domain-containing protein [Bacteroidota bacterium]